MDADSDSLRRRKKRRTFTTASRAAVELVAERGIQAVKVDDICERAEISRSTFFRYFDSKESCFVAGVNQGRLDAVVAALKARPASEEAFTALCETFLSLSGDWRRQRGFLHLEARIRTEVPAVQAHASAEYLVWENALADALHPRLPGDADGGVARRLVAGIVLCAVRLATEQWLKDGAGSSPEEKFAQAFAQARALLGRGA